MTEGVHNPYDDTTLLANIAVIDTVVDAIAVDVDAIRAVTDAEPILEETGGILTTDGTEQDIYINNAPAGVYRPVCLKVDFTAHEATETIVLRVYYRIGDGLALIQQDAVTYIGVPTVPLINIDFEPSRFGIQVTIEKTAGTNRAYPWAVSTEVAP